MSNIWGTGPTYSLDIIDNLDSLDIMDNLDSLDILD